MISHFLHPTQSSTQTYMVINLIKIPCDLAKRFIYGTFYIKACDSTLFKLLLRLKADFLAYKTSTIGYKFHLPLGSVATAATI